jgi:hypothetical protein
VLASQKTPFLTTIIFLDYAKQFITATEMKLGFFEPEMNL